MTSYHRVDPSLPDVADADVHCCHCGQSLRTIRDGAPGLPWRHYTKPTEFPWGKGRSRAMVGTEQANQHPDLCPIDRDILSALIYRAQRIKAGLSLTIELRTNDDAWISPQQHPRSGRGPRPQPQRRSTIDEMLDNLRKHGAA